MSNIRPIGDPAIATAMAAAMRSIETARSAPSGINQTRWRILQCIGKAAPSVPSPGELRLCSGLSKAALAEHLQALRWKGLVEMGGYRLSPSAAAMVGIDHPYPPKDAKAMRLSPPPEAAEKLLSALTAMDTKDMPIMPAPPTIIGFDVARGPDVSAEVTFRIDGDGAVEIVKIAAPIDPADVPACMRPDCMPPAEPIPASKPRRETNRTSKHGRGSAAAARPFQRDSHRDRVAPESARRTTEEVAGSSPAPGQPSIEQGARSAGRETGLLYPVDAGSTPGASTTFSPADLSLPTAPPKFTNWIEQRQQRIAGAIAFLGAQGIPVVIADRYADIRTYFVSANRRSLFAEEVMEMAIEMGWAE